MRLFRWLELVSGLAAGVIGLTIITFVLFGPVYQTAMGSSSCTVYAPGQQAVCTGSGTVYGTATLAQVNNGIPPLALLYFWVLAGVLLSVIASTALHFRYGTSGLRRCLIVTAILLLIIAVAGLDLFVLMVPSVVLALVAVAFAAQNDGPVAVG